MNPLGKTIFGGTAALSASTVATRITSFLSVLLITRSLSLFDYGALTLALSVAGPLAFLSGLGVETAVSADIARAVGVGELGAAKKLYRSFARQKLGATVFIIAAAWFLREPLALRFGEAVGDYFFWIGLWAAANAAASLVTLLLASHARFPIVSLADTTEGLVRLGILGVLFLASAITPFAIIAAGILAKAFGAIVALPTARRLIAPWRGVSETGTSFWGMLRAHGKWSTVSQGVIPQIDNLVRPWTVSFFFGPAGVALISIPSNIFAALSILFPIHKVIAPIIAQRINDPQGAARIAQKAAKLNVWVSVALALIASALIAPFIRVFFPQYEASIVLFWILIPRLPLLALGSAQDPFFQAFRAQRDLVRYQLVELCSDVTLLPLLLRVTGLPGIFLERFLAIAAFTALRESYLRRRHGIATILPREFVRFTAEDRVLVREVFNSFRRKFARHSP